jgi:hypothetical protein
MKIKVMNDAPPAGWPLSSTGVVPCGEMPVRKYPGQLDLPLHVCIYPESISNDLREIPVAMKKGRARGGHMSHVSHMSRTNLRLWVVAVVVVAQNVKPIQPHGTRACGRERGGPIHRDLHVGCVLDPALVKFVPVFKCRAGASSNGCTVMHGAGCCIIHRAHAQSTAAPQRLCRRYTLQW